MRGTASITKFRPHLRGGPVQQKRTDAWCGRVPSSVSMIRREKFRPETRQAFRRAWNFLRTHERFRKE